MEKEVTASVVGINKSKIGVVTMQGDIYNSLTVENLTALHEKLNEFDDDPGIKGLILNSARKNYFSNGLSPSYMIDKSADGKVDAFRKIYILLKQVLSIKKQIVAEISGHANAAGGILAMACDHRIMAGAGRFCFSEVKAGLFLSSCLIKLVLRNINPADARSAIVLSHAFKPQEAKNAALVDEFVDSADKIRSRTVQYFKRVFRIPQESLREAKRVFNRDMIEYLERNTENDMQALGDYIGRGGFDEKMRFLAARLK